MDAWNETTESDELYFQNSKAPKRAFDARLLRKPLSTLPNRPPLVFPAEASVRDAMREMQERERGCVLVTEDGSAESRLTAILTERDVLVRVVNGGRNPAELPLAEVMTPDPESLQPESSISRVLNAMAIGQFRHVPVVDPEGRPLYVVSVRDVVQFLVDLFPREVMSLPPLSGAQRSYRREGA